jgi:hypothetical protein
VNEVCKRGSGCRHVFAGWLGAAGLSLLAAGALARDAADAGRRLVQAYPEQLSHVDGGLLVWRDGTRMALTDGGPPKSAADRLVRPDLTDIFADPYPAGARHVPPGRDADPGRARPRAFFDKLYGDCTAGDVARHLVEIVWLPKKSGQKLKVTRINGVAEKLTAVSAALDALPARFDRYLVPSAGTYACRPIAGTDRISAHGHGIAIDIATAQADYWQWAGHKAGGVIPYRNRVPREIIEIFEAHGFIWGGAWYHYDTMHFEYRPELLLTAPGDR